MDCPSSFVRPTGFQIRSQTAGAASAEACGAQQQLAGTDSPGIGDRIPDALPSPIPTSSVNSSPLRSYKAVAAIAAPFGAHRQLAGITSWSSDPRWPERTGSGILCI
eukprot:gene14862-biopygen8759